MRTKEAEPCGLGLPYALNALRRDGRVVEGGGLENRFPETGRGFESYSLRLDSSIRAMPDTKKSISCGEMAE